MGFDAVDRQFKRPKLAVLECAGGCGVTAGVEMENSRTAYPFDGKVGSLEDPNRPFPLCRACAADHHRYWDEMWADYRSGLL